MHETDIAPCQLQKRNVTGLTCLFTYYTCASLVLLINNARYSNIRNDVKTVCLFTKIDTLKHRS